MPTFGLTIIPYLAVAFPVAYVVAVSGETALAFGVIPPVSSESLVGSYTILSLTVETVLLPGFITTSTGNVSPGARVVVVIQGGAVMGSEVGVGVVVLFVVGVVVEKQSVVDFSARDLVFCVC